MAIGEMLRRSKFFPIEALKDALALSPLFVDSNLEALENKETPWKELK